MESNALKTERYLALLTSLLLLFLPIMYSGRNPTAIMVIEIAGCLILATYFWNPPTQQTLFNPIKWYISLSITITCAYLVPLPNEVWHNLPGRENIQAAALWLETNENHSSYKSLSLIPLNTLSFLVFCLPALGLFLVASRSSKQYLYWIIYALIFGAALQSCLAITQYYSKGIPIDWLFLPDHKQPAGTFVNHNHLTAYVEIIEPLALAIMIIVLVQNNLSKTKKYAQALLFASFSLLLTFVPLTSSSRMGTFLLFLSIILSFWTMTTPALRKKVASAIIGLRLALLALFIFLQLDVFKKSSEMVGRAIDRMQPEAFTGDLRWTLWSTSYQGIKDMFPFGSGPGTFQSIYKQYQPIEINALVEAAHNDYVQMIFEFGATGILLITLAASLFIIQAQNIHKAQESDLKIIQSAAGVGIFLFAIFSITDFNLHTPANTLTLAFLFGVFFRKIPN